MSVGLWTVLEAENGQNVLSVEFDRLPMDLEAENGQNVLSVESNRLLMDLEAENGQNVLSVESDRLPMDFQWTSNETDKIHQLLVMYTYYIYIYPRTFNALDSTHQL